MSFIYFNGEFHSENSLNIISNRGFLYADGLFETMIFNGQEIQFLNDHLERLENGLRFFNYEIPPTFLKELPDLLLQTVKKNQFPDESRIKLIVWRNNGGLYAPNNNSFSLIISCKEKRKSDNTITKLGLNTDFLLPNNTMGNFKTLNSLYYVRAAQICRELEMEDMIFLNSNHKVCECTSSNLFWEIDGKFHTPSLKSGCIAGVMRKNFIKELKSKGKEVFENLYTVEDLFQAEKFHLTNVAGVRTCDSIIS